MKRSEVSKADVAEIEVPVTRQLIGLWRSGWYGIGFGMLAGLIAGATVGTIVPILGNLVGGVIGAMIGAVVGLPAGIAGAGLGGQQGWRVAGALSVLMIGLGILWAIGCAESRTLMPSLPWWIVLVFAGCVQVGFWSGGAAFRKLETGDGFYDRWRESLHEYGLDTPGGRPSAPRLMLALAPVVLLYGCTVLYFLMQQGY